MSLEALLRVMIHEASVSIRRSWDQAYRHLVANHHSSFSFPAVTTSKIWRITRAHRQCFVRITIIIASAKALR